MIIIILHAENARICLSPLWTNGEEEQQQKD